MISRAEYEELKKRIDNDVATKEEKEAFIKLKQEHAAEVVEGAKKYVEKATGKNKWKIKLRRKFAGTAEKVQKKLGIRR